MKFSYRRVFIPVAALALFAAGILYSTAHVRITTNLTWSEDIQPIFREKCMGCHSPGGMAPKYADLTTYGGMPGRNGAWDWKGAIVEEVMMHRMPPWQADSRFGRFSNDRSLTQQEIDSIFAWAEGGAPRGLIRDLPAPPEFLAPHWILGQPELVIEMPEPYVVAADKKSDFVSVKIPVRIEKDQWITGYEFFPGNPRITHSIAAFIHDPAVIAKPSIELEVKKPFDPHALGEKLEVRRPRAFPKGPSLLGEWVRGDAPVLLPNEAGRLLRAGSTIELQVTYRKLTYEDEGKEFKDQPKLGLFFSREEVDLLVESRHLEAGDFTIRAGEANQEVVASIDFDESVHLLGITPHMGPLGVQLEARAVYPDGKPVMLFYVPNYKTKWESSFRFDRPIFAPAGTRIELVGRFNNTKTNESNPNKTPIDVKSGPGPNESQLHAWIDFYLDDHMIVATPTPTPGPQVAESGMSWANNLDPAATERPFTNPRGLEVRPAAKGPLNIDRITKAAAKEDAQVETGGVPAEGPKPAPPAPPAKDQVVARAPDPRLAPKPPAAEVYWCPMRTTDAECAKVETHEPATCPNCKMDLKPRSWFIEKAKGKIAPETAEWKLSGAGIEEIYWCVNRGRPDHNLVNYPGPGKCEICGLILLHKSRFKKVRTYTSIDKNSPDFGKIYYGPGLSPVTLQPVSSTGHMDHSPVHGGMLFMVDNLYHHVEGALPKPDTFRLYFYDDYKEPLDARNFTGRLVIESFDEKTEKVEQQEYPLVVGTEGDNFLTASIPPITEFPAELTAFAILAGKESRFDFVFPGLTVEPPPSEKQVIALMPHEHGEREPIIVPPDAKALDIAREILKRDRVIQGQIAAKNWLGIHNPAFDCIDYADELKRRIQEVPSPQKARTIEAIRDMKAAAFNLHSAGDSGDPGRIAVYYKEYARVVGVLKSIFPEAAK